ncbi:MAG: flagellar motor stator protein MotA [Bryobacteraceae bacterium]
MFAIIGIVIVFGAIIGGYLMEHGNLMVLLQPAELLIIGGAAAGTLLIANPLSVVKAIMKGLLDNLKPSRLDQKFYLEQLKMLNDVFVFARKNGMARLEADVDDPAKSAVFSKYPRFLADQHALAFFCDTVRMAISAGVGPFELDQLMELDLDVQHEEHSVPVAALTTVADALPGLGIVAAVLGVCITMGSIGGPPEEIGHKVASALVGTFLGILLCYGVVGPLSSSLSKRTDAESKYLQFLRMATLAFIKGMAPQLAVEFARRSIPTAVRPTFKETETMIRGARSEARNEAAPPAAA